MTKNKKPTFHKTAAAIPLDKIKVDGIDGGGYQRPINEEDAIRMAMEFDWNEFHVISVSDRGDGYFWCIDGQHRVAAVDLADNVDRTAIPALVYKGLTREDEARMYVSLNKKRKMTSPMNAWKARLTFDEDVKEIEGIVEAYGFKVASGNGFRSLGCVAMLETMYRDFGPHTLGQVLLVIARSFNMQDRATSLFIKGLGLVVGCYGDDVINQEILIGHLRKQTVTRWDSRAKEASAVNTGNQGVWLARHIVESYNSRLSEAKRLAPFDEVYAKFLTAKRSDAAHAFYERKKASLHNPKAKPGSWIRKSRTV